MVGKVWSDYEERYFWRTAVAHSSKRAGIDRANAEKTWDQLAYEMHRAMERAQHVRRNYTSTMLFEHYFQNIEGERRSPNAAAYVNEYLLKVGPKREVVNPRATRPRRDSREVKPRRVRKPAPRSPTGSPDGPHQDKENSASVDSAPLPTLREMGLPDPRPFPPLLPSLSERRNFRPSRPLRPLARAATRMLPPSPLPSPYDNLPHMNQQNVPSSWNMASPPMLSPYAAPPYDPRTPLTPGSGNRDPELWGYQMGKRSATHRQSPSMPHKSQKTSANGYAGQHHYAGYPEMGPMIPGDSDNPQMAFPQAAPLTRESSTSSFADVQNQQRELSAGYQFQDYSSPGSMSIYSSVTSQSAHTQPVSEQSGESTLFVEDAGNDEPYMADREDGEIEESGDDIQEAEVRPDMDGATMTYREFRKRQLMGWNNEDAGYGDMSGEEYYPGLDPAA
ncbi:hypothetical protein F4805DRAFT_473832 [Annulohypoxylon moriforme]|nr:hypothetical protein F4805DRAFT_473832 [Annulohypoxylon moriforme]